VTATADAAVVVRDAGGVSRVAGRDGNGHVVVHDSRLHDALVEGAGHGKRDAGGGENDAELHCLGSLVCRISVDVDGNHLATPSNNVLLW